MAAQVISACCLVRHLQLPLRPPIIMGVHLEALPARGSGPAPCDECVIFVVLLDIITERPVNRSG